MKDMNLVDIYLYLILAYVLTICVLHLCFCIYYADNPGVEKSKAAISVEKQFIGIGKCYRALCVILLIIFSIVGISGSRRR